MIWLIISMIMVAILAIVTIIKAGKLLAREFWFLHDWFAQPVRYTVETEQMHRMKRMFHLSHDLLDIYRGDKNVLIDGQIKHAAQALGVDMLKGGFIEIVKEDQYDNPMGPMLRVELRAKLFKK